MMMTIGRLIIDATGITSHLESSRHTDKKGTQRGDLLLNRCFVTLPFFTKSTTFLNCTLHLRTDTDAAAHGNFIETHVIGGMH